MAWYRLDATDALDEHLLEDCWRLCRDLTCSAEDAGHACAIFERLSGDVRTFYFTPEVGHFAEKLGAQPCAKPSPDGLFLVHGELAAWRTHFVDVDAAQSGLFESTYRLAL
jgi:hypothetical protein